MNILQTALIIFGTVSVAGCQSTAQTISPSKNYSNVKHNIGQIEAISTSSSIDIIYRQTEGKSYAEISAPDNLIPYIVLDESNGELTAYFKEKINISGNGRCQVTVYAPSVTRFTTNASGDIAIPGGIKAAGKVLLSSHASGDIECPWVECNNFKAETCASGDIEVNKVDCHTLQANTNASGDLSIGHAVCQTANLQVNASGNCYLSQLNCKDTVEGMVNASGDLNISGTSPQAILQVAASGDLNAEKLRAEEVSAELNGSGDLLCHPSKALSAQSYGSGDLTYFGNPSIVKTEGKRIYKR